MNFPVGPIDIFFSSYIFLLILSFALIYADVNTYTGKWDDYQSYLVHYKKDSYRQYSGEHLAAFQNTVEFIQQFSDTFAPDFVPDKKENEKKTTVDGISGSVRTIKNWKPAFMVALNEMADWTKEELASRFVNAAIDQATYFSISAPKESSAGDSVDDFSWNRIRMRTWRLLEASVSAGMKDYVYLRKNTRQSEESEPFRAAGAKSHHNTSTGLSHGYSVSAEASGFDSSTHIDWSTANNPFGKSVMSVVRNQGLCGACWAFVSAASVEALVRLAGGKQLPLSVQELVDCDTTFNKGCDGGNPYYAYQYIILNGLSSWDDYPYREAVSTCKSSLLPLACS
jgi:hypothetical protein